MEPSTDKDASGRCSPIAAGCRELPGDEEQRRLFSLAQGAGDPAERLGAEAALIASKVPLVRGFAAKIARRAGADRDDLESAGYETLLRLIRYLDISGVVRVGPYVATAIANAMEIEAKRNVRGLAGSRPWQAEAEKVDGHQGVSTRAAHVRFVSVADIGEIAVCFVSAEDEAIAQLDQGRLEAALATLSPGDREFIASRYGLDGRPRQSQRDLARSLGVSRKAMRDVEASLLYRLAQALGQ